MAQAEPQTGFTDSEISVGDPLAPQTVTIYLSTTCSHCAAFVRDVWPQIDSNLISTKRLRIQIRELPTAPVAVSAAGFLIARCAGRDRYWDVVQVLLSHQDELLNMATPHDAVVRSGELAGLDLQSLERCLSDTASIEALNARRRDALDVGIDGTPTFLFFAHRLEPGVSLDGTAYHGGELTYRQFVAALARFPAPYVPGGPISKESQTNQRRRN